MPESSIPATIPFYWDVYYRPYAKYIRLSKKETFKCNIFYYPTILPTTMIRSLHDTYFVSTKTYTRSNGIQL